MKQYKAFISYSHQDELISVRLHKYLERFRIPKHLLPDKDIQGSRYLYPVFRDREELPSSADLGSQISDALGGSEYLIVICSPASAASRWVNEEILEFKRQGKSQNILTLVIAGEPNATDKRTFPDEEECFPEALKYGCTPAGQVDRKHSTEPIAADFRKEGDGPGDSFLKIAAGLLSVGFDELKRRELRRRQRLAYGIAAVSVAVLLGMGLLAGFAVRNAKDATIQRDHALEQEAEARRQTDLAEERLIEIEHKNAEVESERNRAEQNEGIALSEKERAETNALLALRERDRAESERERAQTSEVDARKKLYSASITQARTFLDQGRIDMAKEALWESPVEHSQWEWGRLAAELNQEAAVVEAHPGGVLNLALSTDNSTLVTTSFNGDGAIWNLRTLELLHRFSGHRGAVRTESLDCFDDRFLTWSEDDSTARLWDVDSGSCIQVFKSRNQISYATMSRSGDRIALLSGIGELTLWDAKEGTLISEAAGIIDIVRFSPDSTLLACGLDDGSILLRDSSDGQIRQKSLGHTRELHSIRFNNDGSRFVSLSRDDSVRIWNTANGEIVSVIERIYDGAHPRRSDREMLADFADTDDRIITATIVTIGLWDSFSSRVLQDKVVDLGQYERMIVSPDGTYVLAIDGLVPEILRTESMETVRPIIGHTSRISDAVISSDNRLCITASEDGSFRIWFAGIPDDLILEGHEGTIDDLVFSPDGVLLASFSDEEFLKVWNTNSGNCLQIFSNDDDDFEKIAFSSESDELLVLEGLDLHLIDTSTFNGRTIASVVRTFACRDDGSEILISRIVEDPEGLIEPSEDLRYGSVIELIHLSDLSVTPVGFEHVMVSQVFLSDDSSLAGSSSSSNNSVCIWNLDTPGSPIVLSGHTDMINGGSFSPDAKRVMTYSRDSTIRIWNSTNGESLQVFEVPPGNFQDLYHVTIKEDFPVGVEWAEFSADGNRILSGSGDRTARIWNIQTGECELIMDAHETAVELIQGLSDESRLLTSGFNEMLWLWSAETGSPVFPLSDNVSKFTISPDESRVAIDNLDDQIIILNTLPWRLEDLPEIPEASLSREEDRRFRIRELKNSNYLEWVTNSGW